MNPKDQIKENLSIVDVVSTYIRLEKSGNQFRARCPFHNERTPSFYVSPERKSFHCFGCQTHGDIFTFVEKIENIPFFEALKVLADRAGIALISQEKSKEETRLISLLIDTTEHFKQNLQSSPEARAYLHERGLTDETIATFQIGYAKNEWRDLFTHLAKKGYQPEEMVEAGVMIEAHDDHGKVKGWYDRFRGRIMFPIRNISGATVGYSGRILPSLVDPTVAQGKYVNTPETSLYHKSKILFGYDTAKKDMMQLKSVVVVEGQMDLCMSYQAGVHNTVAVSGTAFTDEHIHLIKRFCDQVILSFDTDDAGQSALKKTALLCLLGGIDVFVVDAIGTKDPADLIKENREAWLRAVSHKKHVIDVLIEKSMSKGLEERERNKKLVEDVLPYIRALSSLVDRDHFLHTLAHISGISLETLREELMRATLIREEVVSEHVAQHLPSRDRLIKELVAAATLFGKDQDEAFLGLAITSHEFPEAIIQEEMFLLEKRAIGDREAYFNDLMTSYKREEHKAELVRLQKKLKEEGADVEAVLKEIYDHAKKAST